MGEIEFVDLDSFDLTMEEIELMEVADEDEGGEETKKGKWLTEGEGMTKEKLVYLYSNCMIYVLIEAGDFEGLEGEEEFDEVDDDWFYAAAKYAQVGPFSLMPETPSKISEEVRNIS